MSKSKSLWFQRIATVGCVVCRRLGTPTLGARIELHHIAEGSGLRSDYAAVPLCSEHHRGNSGVHGMGTKGFCKLYRLPGESEYGLLVWLCEDLAQTLT